MNREILLEVAIALTIGLLVAVVATYRSTKPVKGGVWSRGGITALLSYAVIAATTLVGNGLTLLGLVLLLALLAVPLVANVRSQTPLGPSQRAISAVVGAGLAAAMLIAGGQTLALLGRVDPRAVVVVIAVIAALLVLGQGLVAAGRVGSTTVWLLIVPVLLSLALGVFVGSPGQAVDPIIVVPGLDWWQIVGLAAAFVGLGWGDNGLRASRREGDSKPVRIWGGAALITVLIAVGQLMFLGGAVISPSLQFMVFPANIDIVPGLAGFLLAIITVLFTAVVVIPLAGVADLSAPGAPRWVIISGVVAAGVALIDPGFATVVTIAGLFGAALLGAQIGRSSERAAVAGSVTAAVVTVILVVVDQARFGWASALGVLVVALVALAVAQQRD